VSERLVRAILEQVAGGKLERNAGAELLKLLKAAEPGRRDDIAIVGMAGRFPDADDPERFWDNLRAGHDSIRPFPEERRKDVEGLRQFTYMKDRDVSYAQAGYLDRIDDFDYRFFGISPKEASLMDPGQRLFLQVGWHALEDAGYGEKSLSGTRTGLYIGYSGWPMYGQFVSYAEPESFDMSVSGNISAIIASRIPHLLDLKGPSMLVDTACSSSLVALHLACRAIGAGECEQALVGGLRLTLMPLEGYVKYGIEASDARAKAFDDEADGTSLSEAVVAIFIKPLRRAIRDGDSIYAVIKGSAINQDGHSINITAPNAKAQEDVLVRAWEDAGIDPSTLSYIEAHGTGTKLGDPIEIDGIQKAFRRYTDRKQFCAIGSLKSNIGHTDAAAGLAGVVKAALALRRRELPPTMHFGFPNRQIAFEQSPVYVNDRLGEWEAGPHPRRCGVSSFGFSGTNAHVVLEEAPAAPDRPPSGEGLFEGFGLLTISAKSESALLRLVDDYARHLERNPDLPVEEACRTAAAFRGHYSHRIAVWGSSAAEWAGALRDWSARGDLSASSDRLLYGFRRVVAAHRRSGSDAETTESEIRERSERANRLLRESRERGRRPTLTDLLELARLYIDGANVDWELAWQGNKPRKARLPVYPFERTRCWLRVPEPEPTASERRIPFAESDYYRLTFGAAPIPRMALSEGRSAADADGTERIAFEADEALTLAAAELARSCGASVSDVVLAVYQTVLSKYSGASELVVGVAARANPAAPAAVRCSPAGYKTFEYFLGEAAALSAAAAEFAPEASALWKERAAGLGESAAERPYQAGYAPASPWPVPEEPWPADIVLFLHEGDGRLRLALHYRTGSLDAGLAGRFAADFLHLLGEAARDRGRQLQALSLPLAEAEPEPAMPEEFAFDL